MAMTTKSIRATAHRLRVARVQEISAGDLEHAAAVIDWQCDQCEQLVRSLAKARRQIAAYRRDNEIRRRHATTTPTVTDTPKEIA